MNTHPRRHAHPRPDPAPRPTRRRCSLSLRRPGGGPGRPAGPRRRRLPPVRPRRPAHPGRHRGVHRARRWRSCSVCSCSSWRALVGRPAGSAARGSALPAMVVGTALVVGDIWAEVVVLPGVVTGGATAAPGRRHRRRSTSPWWSSRSRCSRSAGCSSRSRCAPSRGPVAWLLVVGGGASPSCPVGRLLRRARRGCSARREPSGSGGPGSVVHAHPSADVVVDRRPHRPVGPVEHHELVADRPVGLECLAVVGGDRGREAGCPADLGRVPVDRVARLVELRALRGARPVCPRRADRRTSPRSAASASPPPATSTGSRSWTGAGLLGASVS